MDRFLLYASRLLSSHLGLKHLSFLLFQPLLMLQGPVLLFFLAQELSLDFVKSLLLQHLFRFSSHHTQLFELLHLEFVEFRVFRKLLNDSQLVILLRLQVHHGSLLCLEIANPLLILAEEELIRKDCLWLHLNSCLDADTSSTFKPCICIDVMHRTYCTRVLL